MGDTTPIVSTVKLDKSIRICGDFKQTINRSARCDSYSVPSVEDLLLATLCRGKYFSKLDFSQAYNQVPLDNASRKYTTINTSRGLYEYTRLPFSIASALSIFQRVPEGVLKGIQQTRHSTAHICIVVDRQHPSSQWSTRITTVTRGFASG